ncbi:hypothetical protein Tco_0558594 [Tanacetum coccineum]
MTLWRKIGTTLKFNTTRVDTQTERATKSQPHTLGLYLRLLHPQPKTIEDCFHKAECRYNRAPSKTTGLSPFMVDLPGEYNVSATFNVADLQPYYDSEEPLPSLRTNSSDEGDDVSHTYKERAERTNHPDPTQIGLKWVSLA